MYQKKVNGGNNGVIFADESKFNIHGGDGRVRMWKKNRRTELETFATDCETVANQWWCAGAYQILVLVNWYMDINILYILWTKIYIWAFWKIIW